MSSRTIVGSVERNVTLGKDNWPKVGNVLTLFYAATDSERDEGLAWYQVAHDLAVGMSCINPALDVRRAAGIIAALSPQNTWTHNVSLAMRTAREGKCPRGTLARNCEKADRILAGEDPTDVLSGPKVTAFFHNIFNHASDDHVTIDRHAVHAAFGEVLSDKARGYALRVNKSYNGYDVTANVYRQAAREIRAVYAERFGNVSAAQVQAVVWVVWRNLISQGGRA